MNIQQRKNFRHNVRILAYCNGMTSKSISIMAGLREYENENSNRVASIVNSGVNDFTLKEAKAISDVLGYDINDMLNRLVMVGFSKECTKLVKLKVRTPRNTKTSPKQLNA
jgi:hypothetical protein